MTGYNAGATNSRWRGGIRHDGKGYIQRYVPGHPRGQGITKSYVPEQVIVAEQAIGHYLPPEAVVHHHDGDRSNNANSNLVICENNSYHMLLHARTRIVMAGGDPDTQKLCHICHTLKDRSEFNKRRGTYDGLQTRCRSCHRDYWKAK